MPAERIAMRLVREILRLIAVEKLPVREIARMTGKAPSTVRATLGRCRGAASPERRPHRRRRLAGPAGDLPHRQLLHRYQS